MRKTALVLLFIVFTPFLVFAGGETEEVKETEQVQMKESDTETEKADVFFSSDISAEGLVRIYEKLGWKPEGKIPTQ